MKKIEVNCPICAKLLPIDFYECPDCGCKNPQLQMVKRENFNISFSPEVTRSMKRAAIRKGWSIDRFVNEAVEAYISALAGKG